MWLGKQHGFKNGSKEIKNCSTRAKCLGVKVWRNWMNAYHIAGGEPISLWRERTGPSYELVLLTAMGLIPGPPPVCAEVISQPELGEAEFSEVWSCPCGDSSYIQILRGLCLPQPCLGFSLGRQPRTGFG